MKRHALFVGVNNYTDSTIQNLNYPSEDAAELASVFRRLLKFDRVEKLINPKHSPEIVDAVKDMTRGLGAGDLFLFFFAGHGFRVKENHVLVCARDEFVDLEDEYAGLSVGRLKKRMRGPWNRMLVLDACQNDIRATRGADTGATERDLALIHETEATSSESGCQIVLTACSEGQKALEVSDLGHGLFTSAFLDSVTSFADARRRLDLEALRADLGKRMGGLIAQYRLSGRQEPLFTIPADASGIVLLDGAVSVALPSNNSPVMVECPICGRHNRVEETFKCKICGRDHLCASHFSNERNCCKDCAEKLEVQANTKLAIEAYNSNDFARAFTLAQKSDQNSAVIQYILGYCFTNGYGCEKNQVEATKWYSKAANQGHEEARVCLENIWTTTAVKLANERKNFDEDKFWDEIKRDDDPQAKSEDGHCHSRVFRDELYDGIMRIDWPKALYMINEAEKQIVGELEKEKQITKAIVNNEESVHNLSEIEVENPYLQFQIGMTYYAHPVAMNKELAARWFEKSAKQKCAPSLYMLGRMYEYGESVKQSYVKAKKLFDRVGIDEIPMSDVAIAHMYEFGLADAKDKDAGAAAEWYEYTVGHGCSAVMPLYLRALRMHYSLHPDIEQKFNIQKAAKGSYESFSMLLFSLQECTRSADQGNVEDQNKLGWLYLTGDGVTQDDCEAMKWYRRAADQGDANALYNIGWMYESGRGVAKDDAEAVKWYRKAAELGYVYAQFNLGNGYYNGCGVTKDDAEAVKWYTKAAEQGYSDAKDTLVKMAEQGCVDAQYNLALMYLNGKGVEKNSAEALKWFLQAAEQKNVDAQLWAGVMYGNGNGVPKNFEEAVKWYRAAADQGNATAQFNLGVMYANGLGVKGDLSVAAEWYRKSAAQGNENAREALKKVEGVLRNDEIFKKVMADYLKATNGGVKKTVSSEGAETSGLKTGMVKTLVLPGGAKMEMIYVAPGSFVMGSPEMEAERQDDERQHRVTITKGFWLGKYPVTQIQWKSMMGYDPPSCYKGDNRPVDNVSWYECQRFIEKINAQLHCGARLPTEAEWEYACRAGSQTPFSFGNSLNGDMANCDGTWPYGTDKKGRRIGETTPVGQYKPNRWGFCDMHGNVGEWCLDWYGEYSADNATDPQGPVSGDKRVQRGGSFNAARYCRSAYRDSHDPHCSSLYVGFRLCCPCPVK